MLSVDLLSVDIESVIMLNVVAPAPLLLTNPRLIKLKELETSVSKPPSGNLIYKAQNIYIYIYIRTL
jgi:hypothetical protein